jgi:hypothetical protein
VRLSPHILQKKRLYLCPSLPESGNWGEDIDVQREVISRGPRFEQRSSHLPRVDLKMQIMGPTPD